MHALTKENENICDLIACLPVTGVAEAGKDECSDQGQMAAEKKGSDIDPSVSGVSKDENKPETVDVQQATVETICKEGKTATGICGFECISSAVLNFVIRCLFM